MFGRKPNFNPSSPTPSSGAISQPTQHDVSFFFDSTPNHFFCDCQSKAQRFVSPLSQPLIGCPCSSFRMLFRAWVASAVCFSASSLERCRNFASISAKASRRLAQRLFAYAIGVYFRLFDNLRCFFAHFVQLRFAASSTSCRLKAIGV